jgi:hypothetical protein
MFFVSGLEPGTRNNELETFKKTILNKDTRDSGFKVSGLMFLVEPGTKNNEL